MCAPQTINPSRAGLPPSASLSPRRNARRASREAFRRVGTHRCPRVAVNSGEQTKASRTRRISAPCRRHWGGRFASAGGAGARQQAATRSRSGIRVITRRSYAAPPAATRTPSSHASSSDKAMALVASGSAMARQISAQYPRPDALVLPRGGKGRRDLRGLESAPRVIRRTGFLRACSGPFQVAIRTFAQPPASEPRRRTGADFRGAASCSELRGVGHHLNRKISSKPSRRRITGVSAVTLVVEEDAGARKGRSLAVVDRDSDHTAASRRPRVEGCSRAGTSTFPNI